MKKLSLMKIFEGFFTPQLPGPGTAHMFNTTKPKGDMNLPFQRKRKDLEYMQDDEIEDELDLEESIKLGPTQRDPLNLPGYNMHQGSFANGKGSKSFANYKTNTAYNPDAESNAAVSISKANFEYDDEGFDEEEELELKSEDVGLREKGRAYGAQITTKQPFANGMPKRESSSNYYDEDEIIDELGLNEWISSKTVFVRNKLKSKQDLDFFKNLESPGLYLLNTIEEFEENQRKRSNDKKKKK